MFIRHITITGIDERTDLNKLSELSKKYPKVEWGFLFSTKRMGIEPRYMSIDQLVDKVSWLRGTGAKTSLHMCGQAVRDFLEFPIFATELKHFDRVQLNFNGSAKNKPALCDLAEAMQSWPEIQFIIQHNDNNEYVWRGLWDIPNLALLCDASGGTGEEIQHFPIPAQGIFTGYAGGIGPDNIREIKSDISTLGDGVCWIDMESNVRTNDWLDLNKVEQVLKAV